MADSDSSSPRVLSEFLHPIVVVALLIVMSVIALIAAAVLGVDKGVLRSMGTTQYARGLITYLFAVVTIGTAVVIILAGLLGTDSPETEKRFQRGKEILSLLLGVFGTIVGYYFGADAGTRALILQVSAIHVAPMAGKPGYVTVEAFVAAGSPPYSYGLGLDSGPIPVNKPVPEDGWIVDQFQTGNAGESVLRLVVQDAAGQTAERTVSVNGGTP